MCRAKTRSALFLGILKRVRTMHLLLVVLWMVIQLQQLSVIQEKGES
jgi:hypothetical protein